MPLILFEILSILKLFHIKTKSTLKFSLQVLFFYSSFAADFAAIQHIAWSYSYYLISHHVYCR